MAAVVVQTKSTTPKLPSPQAFDSEISGKKVSLYHLKNNKGMLAAVTNYGARLVTLLVKDKSGHLTNVVAGYDSLAGYLKSTAPYYGAIVGRYANHIAKGKFAIAGKTYQLTINNGPNTLHGGKNGFNNKVWGAKQMSANTLKLSYLAREGEEGFPGNIRITVTYTLTNDNAIKIAYQATTDKPTVVNLTNHSFFNLNGIGSGTVLNHRLYINADKITLVDSTGIPIGTLTAVKGTPFDFKAPAAIGSRINDANQQLKIGKGYDINFVLNPGKNALREVAWATGDLSGITMKVFTTQPGLQFFSGNFMEGKNILSGGVRDDYRTAFCLETQHFPDAPNHPAFASSILLPGQTFKSTTIYKFSN